MTQSDVPTVNIHESVEMARYSFTDGHTLDLNFSYRIYKNSKVVEETSPGRRYAKKGDNSLSFYKSLTGIDAGNLYWTTVRMKGGTFKSEKYAKAEAEALLWADPNTVDGAVEKLNGKDATGYCNVTYKRDKNLVRMECSVTQGDDEYKVELVTPDKISYNSITGVFRITCNGKVIAENIKGSHNGLGSSVETVKSFETEDGSFVIDFMIVEVS